MKQIGLKFVMNRRKPSRPLIVMAFSTPQLCLVTLCEKPKDAWDTVKNHFERETLANKLYFKKHIFERK